MLETTTYQTASRLWTQPEQAFNARAELEKRAKKFEFLFDLMHMQSNELDVVGVLSKYPSELQQMLTAPNISLKHDHDHTNVKTKPPLVTQTVPFPDGLAHLYPDGQPMEIELKSAEMDPSKFTDEERENLDMLIALALKGIPVTIITGKEVMIYPTIRYMHERTQEFVQLAKELAAHDSKLGIHIPELPVVTESGVEHRFGTVHDAKPAVLLLGTGNGGQLFDVFADYELVSYRPIPTDFYTKFTANPAIDMLLRESTADKRRRQLGIIFEQYRKTPSEITQFHQYIQDHPEDTLAQKVLIGDYMNLAPSGAKINWVLDKNKILADDSVGIALRAQWKELTGVDIVNGPTLFQAARQLFVQLYGTEDESQWSVEITPAFANGDTFVDITARGVNKGDTMPIIDTYIQSLYARYGYHVNKFTSLTNGDKPDGNDEKMLVGVEGAVTVSVETNPIRRPQVNGFPVYLDTVYASGPGGHTMDSIEMTHKWLHDLLVIRSLKRQSHI